LSAHFWPRTCGTLHAQPPPPRTALPQPWAPRLPGRITFKNLKRVAKELGENLTDEEIQEMIDEADRNGDGEVCVCGGEGRGRRALAWRAASPGHMSIALPPRHTMPYPL
jgi:hypothetical protein